MTHQDLAALIIECVEAQAPGFTAHVGMAAGVVVVTVRERVGGTDGDAIHRDCHAIHCAILDIVNASGPPSVVFA